MASSRAVSPSLALVIGAMGVVFGDVGTSPLYAFRAVFTVSGLSPAELANIQGVLSLVFWSIASVVALKYVTIVLRADNDGEGGVLALMQLARGSAGTRAAVPLTLMGLIGCALFFGDGVITPAISVLSAVEGLELAAPSLAGSVVPITVVILLVLFRLQRKGTERIGRAFGPIMLLWFTVLAVLGTLSIVQSPEVLVAVHPAYAFALFIDHPGIALAVFGAVFLCVTGGEALYADLGHFGRPAIARAWYFLVWPALLLNYFGQGALLLRDPAALASPFYKLAPAAMVLPLVLLATAATVIASQAVISGVFSIARQCQQLGFLPRMRIVHSSEEAIGQVYVPFVNWALCLMTLLLVVAFGSSDRLAGAYGVVLALEALYILGNLQKIGDGGWVPLALGSTLFFLMQTWRSGRDVVASRTAREDLRPAEFVALVDRLQPTVVDRTVVFLSGNAELMPRTLVRNLQTNRVLHAQTIVMTLHTASVPRVDFGSRVRLHELRPGLYRVVATIGFMDRPDIPALLREAQRRHKELELRGAAYVIGRDDVVTTGRSDFTRLQKALFAFMSRNAEFAGDHFGIPAEQILESGGQVAI
jgi:KUP system potassium uptake protein